MNHELNLQMQLFFQEISNLHNDNLPLTPFDQEWPSPCYQSEPDANGLSYWQPIKQPATDNPCLEMFDRMEEALGYPIHPDIRSWYSSYWSDPIPARCDKGDLSLIFIWNEKDCERLRGNLIGHLLTKQKQKRPATLFFACTEPDGEQFLTVDNQTGEIWLEKPGKAPIMKLADSLCEFIAQLEPLPIPDQE